MIVELLLIVIGSAAPPLVRHLWNKRRHGAATRAALLYNEGITLSNGGRFAEAQEVLERAHAAIDAASAPSSQERARYLWALAWVHCRQEHFTQARQLCRHALALPSLPPDLEFALHDTLGESCYAIGYALGTQEDLEEAERAYEHALALAGDDHVAACASFLDRLGTIHTLRGDHVAAEKDLSLALDLWRADASPYFLARSLQRLAVSRTTLGKLDDARNLLREALGVATDVMATEQRAPGSSPYRSPSPHPWTSLRDELTQQLSVLEAQPP
jgi:tetratricopeptide (TPR) repeat protein